MSPATCHPERRISLANARLIRSRRIPMTTIFRVRTRVSIRVGILRLRENLASRRSRYAQDDNSALRPRQIRALGRVHFDFLAFVDERRNLHYQAGFGSRGFGDAAGGRALQAGLGFDHGENHGLGKLDAYGLAVEKLDFDFEVGDEVLHGVAQDFLGEVGLLVVGRVHEVVAVAVSVEELHVDFVHGDLLDGIGRTETVLEHGAGAQVAQLGLDEGAQVAGRTVFDGKYGVQIIVVPDDHAGTHLGGRDRHRLKTSPCTIAVRRASGRTGRPQFRRYRG